MPKAIKDLSPAQLREQLERVTPVLSSDPSDRARWQIMKTLAELEMMGLFHNSEETCEVVRLEYDKFRPTVR